MTPLSLSLFFFQKYCYWGVKSPKNEYRTRIEAIFHCYGINLLSLYSVKGKVVLWTPERLSDSGGIAPRITSTPGRSEWSGLRLGRPPYPWGWFRLCPMNRMLCGPQGRSGWADFHRVFGVCYNVSHWKERNTQANNMKWPGFYGLWHRVFW